VTPAEVPGLAGLLTAREVRATARSIVAVQESSGAIPWVPGGHTDVWNHVEAAMALLAAGEVAAAERAYAWVPTVQRADGSVPLKVVGGRVEDASGETNMSAYLAVGLWHHWLLRRDLRFVRRIWPAVRRGLDFAVSLQLRWGGIAWSQEWHDGAPARVNEQALLAASSSVHHALRAGLALSDLLDEPQPEWELAGGRLAHAVREHEDLFLDKAHFSMDWYYPVLGGVLTGDTARQRLEERWDTFVEDGLGIRCVSRNPWVTGAETSELALALEAIGDRDRAARLLADMQHLRRGEGAYWTGYVFPDRAYWPDEQTTFTSAAVILAVDALSDTTAGAGIMRAASLGPSWGPDLALIGLECGCPSADGLERSRLT
jgi:hypothetical protein